MAATDDFLHDWAALDHDPREEDAGHGDGLLAMDEAAELASLKAANEGWKRAFNALHDTLEKIAGPRNADLSYAELHHESQRWAAGALHTEDA